MGDENVLQMPTHLDRLAVQIKHDLERGKKGRGQWIDATYDLCLHLAEARGLVTADIAFGEWCEANGFGKKVLNHQTRAAAIAMGKEPEALRKCLEATDRHSLHTIHALEFSRFTNVCKPATAPRKSRRGTSPSKVEAARKAVRLLVEGEKTVHRQKLAVELGVGEKSIQLAEYMERGRLEALSEAEALPPAEMVPATKRRYDAAVMVAEKRLRAELTAEITEQVNREFDVYLTHWKERIARSDRIIAAHKGVMTRQQFRLVLAGLHPDHNTFPQAASAFELFKKLEDVLVKPEIPVVTGPAALPKTVAEMMARRTKRSK